MHIYILIKRVHTKLPLMKNGTALLIECVENGGKTLDKRKLLLLLCFKSVRQSEERKVIVTQQLLFLTATKKIFFFFLNVALERLLYYVDR